MYHLKSRWDLGQGLVEYALVLVLVALAVVAGLGLMGTELNVLYTEIYDKVSNLTG